QALVNIPMRIPNAPLDDKQQALINNSERDKILSSLTGEARVIKQAEFSADDVGLTNTPEHAENRQKYINNLVTAFQNREK
ncbi:phage tail tape measure protein, partial [Proteus faecis]